jgi:hypothetical protein
MIMQYKGQDLLRYKCSIQHTFSGTRIYFHMPVNFLLDRKKGGRVRLAACPARAENALSHHRLTVAVTRQGGCENRDL